MESTANPQLWRTRRATGYCIQAITMVMLLWTVGCGPPPEDAALHQWPAADALFHAEPRWRGADDAYSVDLGQGRVLWLFADTFVQTRGATTRPGSRVIRNSVAIQRGYDPRTADISFYWRGSDEHPESFIGEPDQAWYWPGDGPHLRVESSRFQHRCPGRIALLPEVHAKSVRR